MVMTTEGVNVKPILSHEAQGNDSIIINLCNTCLRTLHQFPLLFEWRHTLNTETLQTFPKFWILERMTTVSEKCFQWFLVCCHAHYQFFIFIIQSSAHLSGAILSQFLTLMRIIIQNGNVYSVIYILINFCLIVHSLKKPIK